MSLLHTNSQNGHYYIPRDEQAFAVVRCPACAREQEQLYRRRTGQPERTFETYIPRVLTELGGAGLGMMCSYVDCAQMFFAADVSIPLWFD